MTAAERERILDEMHAVPGVYVVGDTEFPGAVAIVVSLGGRVFSTKLDGELVRDRWKPTVTYHGGIILPPGNNIADA